MHNREDGGNEDEDGSLRMVTMRMKTTIVSTTIRRMGIMRTTIKIMRMVVMMMRITIVNTIVMLMRIGKRTTTPHR